MDDKRDDILSAMRSIAGDITPTGSPRGGALPAVSIDFGGISLKNGSALDHAQDGREAAPQGLSSPQDVLQRRDIQQRNVLRMLGYMLMFAAIAPLYLVEMMSDQGDDMVMTIGFLSLVMSLASFTVAVVLDRP
jgi:hypothetical protein